MTMTHTYDRCWDINALDKPNHTRSLRFTARTLELTRKYYQWIHDWRLKYVTLIRLQKEYMPEPENRRRKI